MMTSQTGALTIYAALRRAFEETFSNRIATFGEPPSAVADFEAGHPIVGNASVWLEDGVPMVVIGDLTHRHFEGESDGVVQPDEQAQVIADLVQFLHDLFADRVLLWRRPGTRGLGGSLAPADDIRWSLIEAADETFYWSGPATNPVQSDAG